MLAPPLAELYDLLRAEGFAIGVDDHVRIGRLLAHEVAWTPELLRTVIAALVMTGPNDCDAFDACWERWLGGVEPRRPVASEPLAARVDPPGTAAQGSHREPPPAERELPQSRVEPPATERRVRILRLLVLAATVAVVSAVAIALVVRPRAGSGSGQQVAGAGSGSGQQVAGAGSGSGQHEGSGSGSDQHAGSASGSGQQVAGPGSGSGQLVGTGIGSDDQLESPNTSTSAAGFNNKLVRPDTTLDIMRVTVALGTMVLAIAATASVIGARRRRRFVPGPWRYVLAVPPAARPVLPRNAIEDAAADLTWQAPGTGQELDVARSVAATVDRGGLPTLTYRRQVAAPRYLVLEDTAGGAGRWQPIYDELLAGLAREGLALARYTFAANPAQCVRPDGDAIPLGELVDHADALIVIGDGAAGVDPLDGRRVEWLASLRQIPRRLWINPLPPARWSAGAHAIAEDTPMEHGVARAVTKLHAGVDRRVRLARPYPAVIECAPETASAIVALRTALSQPAFQLVSAVAMTGPPTIAAARWLAEVLAVELDEQDWLAVATLPWFCEEEWPGGLREQLRRALGAEAPDLARAVAVISDDLFASSEPPCGSAAHLAWQIEGADRAAHRGDRAVAVRTLNRITETPLAHQARRLRAALGLPDRVRRARTWAVGMGIGVALIVGPLAYRYIPARSLAPPPTLRCPTDMVPVHAGTFWMGSPDGESDEQPEHEVSLSAYCIDRTEVTVESYAACLRAGSCTAAARTVQWKGYSTADVKRNSRFCNGDDRPDHPMNCVDWNQATAYCTWVGRRLPTEAEWEFAARGTDNRAYPWGNEPPSAKRLNACGGECVAMVKRELEANWILSMYNASDDWETTAPVGNFPDGASPFGALDMAGNIWEWTADWYGPYSGTAVTNPHGAEAGTGRVIRGGAWESNDTNDARVAYRLWLRPSNRDQNVGFRCVRGH